MLPPDSPELLTLMLLRDEAHGFAISYQKKLRQKERLRSELDLILGIGEARKTVLLRRFGSLAQLRQASLAELSAVEGLGPGLAKRVYEFFHQGGANSVS